MFARLLTLSFLCLTLTSCSTFGLLFDHLPDLTVWQMDRMFDLTDTQEEIVEQGAESVQIWMVSEGFPELIRQLEVARDLWQDGSYTQASVVFEDIIEERISAFLLASRPHLVAFMMTLDDANVEHYRSYNDEKKEDWFAYAESEADKDESRRERLEEWFGDVSNEQEERGDQLIQLLPDEKQIRLANNDHWKEKFLAAALARNETALSQWLADPSIWWLPAYAQLREENRRQRRELVAMMIDSMSPEQSEHVVERVDDWIDDLKGVL